jgi:xanthine dehydrogenase YagR molybdenum-binding subunit
MVGAFAAGRIMNPRTARSQLAGGQIWGISSALLEAAEIDRKLARYVNDNLAEYHIPVNADVGEVKTLLIDETDELVNPLGIKGVGELGITGVNAAVANAVYHATGIRCRKLPIRVEDVLGADCGVEKL